MVFGVTFKYVSQFTSSTFGQCSVPARLIFVRVVRWWDGNEQKSALLQCEADRVHRASDNVGLHDERTQRKTALQTVALDQMLRKRPRTHRLFTDKCSAAFQYLFGQLTILTGINRIQSIGKNSDRVAFRFQRGSMGLRVNTDCESTDDTPIVFG